MPKHVRLSGSLGLTVLHVISKRGVLWYQRRIPNDMLSAYPKGRTHIRESLGTKTLTPSAIREVAAKALRDDAYWKSRRSGTLINNVGSRGVSASP